MKNKKQSKIKIVLPVLFTFGASLMFFQADGQADSTQPTSNEAQVAMTTNNANTQNNNYQSLNGSATQQNNAQATTQSASAATNNYSVSLSDSAVQAAVNKPVVSTTPTFSTNQYNVSADPIDAANGGSGSASLNTAGLTASQKAF